VMQAVQIAALTGLGISLAGSVMLAVSLNSLLQELTVTELPPIS
jgi:hypothetical protein